MTDEPLADEYLELEPDLPPGQVPDEDALKHRSVKRTAAAQGSNIPQGWKPSLRKPIPVVRCHYIFKDTHAKAGEQCEKWSLRGSLLCYTHGGRGNLQNVEDYRKAIVDAARLELTENVPMALDTLFHLAQNSGADNVRLKAAESILDRTGIKTADQLEVSLEVTQTDPAAVLAERLGKLKDAADKIASARAEARQAPLPDPDQLALTTGEDDEADIIEAEVVDDTPDTGDGESA